LTLVVGKERPDLAKKKVELIQQQNEFKIKLKELEDDLLSRLANAQGDILADVELIENLETSKRIAVEVQEKVIIAKATEININEASEKYRTVADRGALIFFLMNELAKIHSFYMYSLESFVVVVNRAIDSLSEGLAKPKKAEAEPAAAEEAAAESEVVAAPERKRTVLLLLKVEPQKVKLERSLLRRRPKRRLKKRQKKRMLKMPPKRKLKKPKKLLFSLLVLLTREFIS